MNWRNCEPIQIHPNFPWPIWQSGRLEFKCPRQLCVGQGMYIRMVTSPNNHVTSRIAVSAASLGIRVWMWQKWGALKSSCFLYSSSFNKILDFMNLLSLLSLVPTWCVITKSPHLLPLPLFPCWQTVVLRSQSCCLPQQHEQRCSRATGLYTTWATWANSHWGYKQTWRSWR